jgi:hypothetical protein
LLQWQFISSGNVFGGDGGGGGCGCGGGRIRINSVAGFDIAIILSVLMTTTMIIASARVPTGVSVVAVKGRITKYSVQHSKKAKRNLVLQVATCFQFRVNYVLCFWSLWKNTTMNVPRTSDFWVSKTIYVIDINLSVYKPR